MIYDDDNDDTRHLSLTSQQNQKKSAKGEYDNENIKSILLSNHNTRTDLAQSQLHSKNDLNLDNFDKPSSKIYKADIASYRI